MVMGLGPRALTEVGELHSLTDWQVSEASEDAELEDFCHAEASGWSQMGARGQTGQRGGEEKRVLVTAVACSGMFDSALHPAFPSWWYSHQDHHKHRGGSSPGHILQALTCPQPRQYFKAST